MLLFLCSACCLIVLHICVKSFMKTSLTVFKLQKRHKYMTEITIYNVQWATTLKVGKPELWYFCSASRLVVFYISATFYEIS